MNPSDTNDPLDALLREQNDYIEDNGFTARVMGAPVQLAVIGPFSSEEPFRRAIGA